MVKPQSFFEDLSRLATDAVDAAQGMKKDAETMFRTQFEKLAQELDLASKEELDVIKELATKALEENKELQKRLDLLQERVDKLEADKA